MSLIPDYTIKRNDVGRVISGVLKSGGAAANTTGHTSRKFIMRHLMSDVVKINGANFTLNDAGAWSYAFQAADVDTSGWYKLEHEVGLPGPQTVSFPTDPDDPFLIVLVQDDLG